MINLRDLRICQFLCYYLDGILYVIFLCRRATVSRAINGAIIAMGYGRILSLFRYNRDLFQRFNGRVFFDQIANVRRLRTVRVSSNIVIIEVFRVCVFALRIIFGVHFATCPSVLFSPLNLNYAFVFRNARDAFSFFPYHVVGINVLPTIDQFLYYVLDYPSTLFQNLGRQGRLGFFHSRRAMGLSICLNGARRQRILANPIFRQSIVRVVHGQPNANMEIGRRRQVNQYARLAFFALSILQYPAATRRNDYARRRDQ